MKTTCPICKGSGKLPVVQQPKAESHGEEMMGECPTCHSKGEVDREEEYHHNIRGFPANEQMLGEPHTVIVSYHLLVSPSNNPKPV